MVYSSHVVMPSYEDVGKGNATVPMRTWQWSFEDKETAHLAHVECENAKNSLRISSGNGHRGKNRQTSGIPCRHEGVERHQTREHCCQRWDYFIALAEL